MPKRQIIRIDEALCNGCGQCVSACHEGAIRMVDGKARLVGETYCDGLGACIGDCPTRALTIETREAAAFDEQAVKQATNSPDQHQSGPSMLAQWPVQLMLVPPTAPYLQGADLVVCADCVPFAVPDFHSRYLAGRSIVVGCPKLDDLGHYREKLAEIIATARPRSLTVVRMEVPCCGGIAHVLIEARDEAGPELPITVDTVGVRGDIRRQIHQKEK